MVGDMFPRKAVATVIGIGGFGGAMAGMLVQRATGRILDATHGSYTVVFMVCGVAYLFALSLIQLLAPRLEPVRAE